MSLNLVYRIKDLEQKVADLEYTVHILTRKRPPGRPFQNQPQRWVCVRCDEEHPGGFENCVEKVETPPQEPQAEAVNA